MHQALAGRFGQKPSALGTVAVMASPPPETGRLTYTDEDVMACLCCGESLGTHFDHVCVAAKSGMVDTQVEAIGPARIGASRKRAQNPCAPYHF